MVNDLKYIYTQECGVATNVQPKDYSKQIHILGHLGKVILCIFSFYAYSCVKHGDQPLHFFPYNIWTQKNCKIKKNSEHLLYYGCIFNYNTIGCGIDSSPTTWLWYCQKTVHKSNLWFWKYNHENHHFKRYHTKIVGPLSSLQ